ncbi:MAG: alpha/beta hydrolase [Gemmatimonadetes bacterium]|nr:alpha/beta hydrolase [Gemmatimonadota bacterium]MBL0178681.1 alpha/beta hydrolase [Gemmatimonadota bacterium]
MGARWLVVAGVVALTACETMTMSDPGNLVPRTVMEDSSLPSLTINGTRLHAETRGDPAKPVMVVLHGGPGGDYRSLLRLAERYDGYSLADHYHMIFWDQRGAGLSQRHDKDLLTIDQYDADLLALVDRFAPGRQVTLLGQSWGGIFGTSFIDRHPTRVKEAVFIESGPLTGSMYERIKGQLFDINLLREWLNDVAWTTQFFSPDEHVRMDYQMAIGAKGAQPRNNVRQGPGAEPSWREGAFANRYLQEDGQDGAAKFNYDFTANLQAFTGRVLLIAGARSEVLGPTLQQAQRPLYRTATLKIVDGGGHDVHWTHTAEVMGHVRAFLAVPQGGGAQ